MERKACCEKEGAWSSEEEEILRNYVQVHGEEDWKNLPQKAGLNRCGESCKHRWMNYLKPAIYDENFSSDEKELIIKLHKLLGNRWSIIAGRLPGRTEIEIERFWNTHLSKREEDNHNNKDLPSTSVNFQSLVRCTQNSLGIHPAKSSHLVIKPKAVKLTKALKPIHKGSQF